jgi:hypothetical protein
MKNIGVLGFGEIGSSVAKIYENYPEYSILVKDLERDDDLKNLKCLNICIPYSEKFSDIVLEQINYSTPELVIVHSTIVPGTIETIQEKTNVPIVHSPVMGVHPNLYDGIMTFTKFIGCNNVEHSELAEKHLKSLGVKTHICTSSRSTELGKMLSTTYYGTVIAAHGEMKKICDELNVNFTEAVSMFNQVYNVGYAKLGKINVIRPVLYPPKNDKIGGHCVVPNAKLLKKCLKEDNDIVELVLKYDK